MENYFYYDLTNFLHANRFLYLNLNNKQHGIVKHNMFIMFIMFGAYVFFTET
jgi:hypothetical protein